jgi:hypothetical protein
LRRVGKVISDEGLSVSSIGKFALLIIGAHHPLMRSGRVVPFRRLVELLLGVWASNRQGRADVRNSYFHDNGFNP